MHERTIQRLAERDAFSVDLCACGMLHLTIGPLTLRLPAEACESLRATLATALHGLSEFRPRGLQ